MDFVKAGKVVKFIDENGEKNAGTVVEIVKQQGIKKAVISVLKEVAEELGKEVVETKIPKKDNYLVVGDKVLKPLKNLDEGESENTIDKDKMIKDLEFKVLSLEQQLSSSKEQINDLEKMKVSIIHLAKALKVRTTELGESKTINELLTCILELNNLGELVVD